MRQEGAMEVSSLTQVGGAVLFADLANSTGLMEQTSEPIGRNLDTFKRHVAEDVLPSFAGRFVKSTGDATVEISRDRNDQAWQNLLLNRRIATNGCTKRGALGRIMKF